MPDDTADDHQSFRQQRALQDLVIGAQLGCFDILDTDELWQIVSLSFCVSLTATFLASLAGISLAAVLAVYSFPGRRTLVVLTNAFLGLPPVVVGLVLYLLQRVLSRTGSSRPTGKPRSALTRSMASSCSTPRPRRRNNLQLLCLGFGPGFGTGPGERANTFLILREFGGSP